MVGFREFDKLTLARHETQMVRDLFAASESDRAGFCKWLHR
jgi:hypothetical protein